MVQKVRFRASFLKKKLVLYFTKVLFAVVLLVEHTQSVIILSLSHEVNWKTMQPRKDPFQIMMKINRLAADLHRLGDRSVTELRKCVVVVAGLSADYEIEAHMLDNNPTGLDKTEIERVVGNQYNRLLRQQQDSKALSASKGITTEDRGEKQKRSRNRFEGNCFNCGRKDHRAEDCRSVKKNQEMPTPTRRAEVGASSTSVEVRSTLCINTVACAEALSTGLVIVRSEEPRRVQWCQK